MSTTVPGSMQRVWGWKVIWHMFVVGTAAGLYIAGFILSYVYPESSLVFTIIAVCLTAPLLIIGLILLISHLGIKVNSIRAFRNAASSWLSRGSIALVTFLILDIVHIGLLSNAAFVQSDIPTLHLIIGIITSLSALFVLLYTGMLLARLKSFPCWRTWLLPPLFIISGLSSGLMLLILLITILNTNQIPAIMRPLLLVIEHNNYLLIIQGLILGLYTRTIQITPSAKNYVSIMTKGHGAIAFWLGIVAAGLLIPFGLGMYLVLAQTIKQIIYWVFAVELGVFGLVGAIVLRYSIISMGVSSNLSVEGNTAQLPENARVPASHCVRYH